MTNLPDNYANILKEIKQRIRSGQYIALKAINREQISLYWDIGRIIIERQQEVKWGKSVVENLARDIQDEFQGIKGFSAQNLWYMR